jgi:hypothetical protein
MPVLDHLLKRAVELSKAGKKDDARRLLNYILKQDPQNETAWLWYADTFESPAKRQIVLQKVLEINPSNPHALRAMEKMRLEAKPAPTPAPLAPRAQPAPAPARPARPKARADSAHRARSLPFPLILGILLCLAAAVLWGMEKYQTLQQDYLKLSVEKQQLNWQYTDLDKRYQGVVSENHLLADTNRDLTDQNQALSNQYQDLWNQHLNLSAQYAQLDFAYSNLSAQHNTLAGEYEKLDREAVKPPYIWIHDREVQVAFYRLDQQLLYWSVPFEALEWAIGYGDDLRDDPPKVGLTNSDGDSLLVTDYTVFADPEMFDDVIPDLYYEINDPDQFIQQAWYIVAQLSHWSKEEGDVPRTPLETLLAGGGDCEDLSILMASLVKAAPVDWKVELVLMDTDHVDRPISTNHMIVSIEYGDQRRLIETTNTEVMEPYTTGVTGWYFEVK